MTNFTRAWNTSYEAIPPDSGENASLGAGRIRNFKLDLRERMVVDHIWNDTLAVASEDGEHAKVTLEQRAAPAQMADRVIAYGFDYNNGTDTKCELYVINEDGNITRLTDRGLIAILRSANVWNKAQRSTEVVLTEASTIAVDASLANAFIVTLTGNRTLGLPTNGGASQVISIRIVQDAVGGRTLSLSNYKGSTSDDLVLSTAADAEDLLTLYCVAAGTDWRVINLKKDIGNAL